MSLSLKGNHVEIGMVLDDLGPPHFTVDVIDRDYGTIRVWDGQSYEIAILQAEAAREDFGPVEDRVLDALPPVISTL